MIATIDLERQRSLRRMKAVPTVLLVLAAVVYVFAKSHEEAGEWVSYVRAASEAAMVGALADWFAVTALFRHPLWIPIPHTAIIPNNKDRIGRSLGEFVEGNFLTREVLVERLHQVEITRRLGGWLEQPDNARRTTVAMTDALKGSLELLDDSHVQEAIGGLVERRLRATSVAPVLAKAVDVSIDGGHVQRLLDVVFKGLGVFMEENEATFRQQLKKESPWWVPEPIDDRVFNRISAGVQSFLADVRTHPDHDVRQAVDKRLRVFADRLRDDPEMIAKVEEMKEEVISHPEVQAWLQSLWIGMKRAILADADDPNSDLQHGIEDGLVRLGHRLAEDRELQAKVDGWIERVVVYLIEHYRSQVAELIATTVERWDGKDAARRIELTAGHDLQFIRINGTIIGALAGLLIYSVGQVLP